MKPCWRRWATSQGCFSLLSVSRSTAGLPSDSSGRLLFLPDHFWRRNLPDCTAGSGPLALRSVGGTELSLCANDPCQAQGSRACCGAGKGDSADANEVHIHSVSVCAESCTSDNIHPLEFKMSDFRETWMVTNENEERDTLFMILWPQSVGWIASLCWWIICRLSYRCIWS